MPLLSNLIKALENLIKLYYSNVRQILRQWKAKLLNLGTGGKIPDKVKAACY